MKATTLPASGAAVLVTAAGPAEGALAAAAALACAGADVDRPTLLIDVGGRPPRPTLLASSAAQLLEERLVSHLPEARVAARGHVCHLAVAADPDGFEMALSAATVSREELRVVHAGAASVEPLLDVATGVLSGALLRADLPRDRPLLALAVPSLRGRVATVAVLKHRLAWVAERRALFGALPPAAAGGLPASIRRRLLSADPFCP
ncbi:MAG: hypothetical protein ABW065_09680 [Solirubrobacterales bacterium]